MDDNEILEHLALKMARIKELEHACKFALNTYNSITSKDFSLGRDKQARSLLESALGLTDFEDYGVLTC